jgi:hypothetical protein
LAAKILRVDGRLIEDPDGSMLPNLEEAHLEAVQGARDILAEQLRRGATLDDNQVEIHDEAGALIDTVRSSGGKALLEALDRQTPFIVPLDDRRADQKDPQAGVRRRRSSPLPELGHAVGFRARPIHSGEYGA